ncbi:MAG: 3-deoxy-manno-octulosonate cytidylyltransferase, partial [Anaerolinea sp.]|nr:3-deoxy-manno-octulosonate cytidylyltransferase [Anaerolinea sp.]
MNTICIIQARMGSERLPGKILLPLLDQPMLAQIVRRAAQA